MLFLKAEIFPVIELSMPIMNTYGLIKADLYKTHLVVDYFDLSIGATAIAFRYSVVTHNIKRFSKMPYRACINWTH